MTLRLFSLISALVWAFIALPAEAQGYRIRSGDTLSIEVAKDPTLNRDLLVAPDGNITIPPIGQIRAGGRTLLEVQLAIESALRPNFAGNPRVFVSLRALRPPPTPFIPAPEETVTVYVTGEMNAPGALQVTPRATLLQVVAAAGGPTRFAAMNRVQLRRVDPRTGQEQLYQINVEALLEGRASAPPFRIREGDVLIVPERRLFE